MSLWLEPAVFAVLLNSWVLLHDELRDLVLEAAHRHLDRVLWTDRFLQDTARTLLTDGRTAPEQAARWQSEQPRAG